MGVAASMYPPVREDSMGTVLTLFGFEKVALASHDVEIALHIAEAPCRFPCERQLSVAANPQ